MPEPMTFDSRLGQNGYLGRHADDAAALAFVQAEKLDTKGDGTGSIPQGAWYHNTTSDAPRFTNAAGATTPAIPVREVFWPVDGDTPIAGYRTVCLSNGGKHSFMFACPADFTSLISLEAIGIAASTDTAADIDLTSIYAAIGEPYNNHTAANTAQNYNLNAAGIKRVWNLSLASLFPSLAAGDFCGVEVVHTNVTGQIYWFGIRMKYR